MDNQANEPGWAEAIAAVQRVMDLPPEARSNYLEMLGHVAVHYMRAMNGVEYTRGWLDSCIGDLDKPSIFTVRRPS